MGEFRLALTLVPFPLCPSRPRYIAVKSRAIFALTDPHPCVTPGLIVGEMVKAFGMIV